MRDLRRLLIVIGVLAALVVSAGLIGVLGGDLPEQTHPAAADTTSPTHGITVTGQGIVLVSPDTGQATLGVQVQNPNLATAQSQATQQMNAVQSAIKSKGVAENKIKTVVYNISINRNDKDSSQITGYTVIDLIQFSVKPVNQLGPVLQAAIDAGANVVQGVTFTVEDTNAALQQARQQAMDDAHNRAQQLAQLAGVTLGAPISVAEGVSSTPTPQSLNTGVAASAAGVAPSLQSGESQIMVTVTVTYGF